MSRIIYGILFILLLILGVAFAGRNAAPVTLNYFVGSIDIPLSLLLIGVLTIGAILGVIASMGMLLHTRRQVHRLKKSSKKQQATSKATTTVV